MGSTASEGESQQQAVELVSENEDKQAKAKAPFSLVLRSAATRKRGPDLGWIF